MLPPELRRRIGTICRQRIIFAISKRAQSLERFLQCRNDYHGYQMASGRGDTPIRLRGETALSSAEIPPEGKPGRGWSFCGEEEIG